MLSILFAALHDKGEEPFYASRLFEVPEAAGQSDVFFAWHWEGNDDWWWAIDNIKVTAGADIEPIPEPGTLLLLCTGLAGLAGYGIRRRKKA